MSNLFPWRLPEHTPALLPYHTDPFVPSYNPRGEYLPYGPLLKAIVPLAMLDFVFPPTPSFCIFRGQV